MSIIVIIYLVLIFITCLYSVCVCFILIVLPHICNQMLTAFQHIMLPLFFTMNINKLGKSLLSFRLAQLPTATPSWHHFPGEIAAEQTVHKCEFKVAYCKVICVLPVGIYHQLAE